MTMNSSNELMLPKRTIKDPWPHLAALGVTAVGTVLVWIGFNVAFLFFGVYDRYGKAPSLQWQAGWMAISFYIAWWGTFFLRDDVPDTKPDLEEEQAEREKRWNERITDRRVIPLPTFLEYNTFRRDPFAGQGIQEAIDHYVEKAGNTIQTISAIVGFSLLIFSLTLSLILGNPDKLSQFQRELATGILLVQVVAIVAFVIGMDQMDTSMNRFVGYGDEVRYRITRHYYRKGIYYYYRGLVILIFSAFLSMMLVYPWITVVGVGVFAVLGYNYWFGYTNGYVFELKDKMKEGKEAVGVADGDLEDASGEPGD